MTRTTSLLVLLVFLGALLGTAHAAAPDASCADACAAAGMHHDTRPFACPGDDACAGHANPCLAHGLAVLNVAVEPPHLARATGPRARAPDATVGDAPPGRLLRPPIPA